MFAGTFLEPLSVSENEHGHERNTEHDTDMDPKRVGTMAEGNARAHGEDIGVDRHREHHCREDGQDLHREVELVGKEGIVGRFEGLDDFLVVFEDVPEADIGADEVLKIHLEAFGDEGTLFLEERLDDGALGLERSAEIEDIALHHGDLEDHLFFSSIEDAFLDIVKVLGDVVEAGEAGAHEHIKNMIHEVRGRLAHMETSLPFVFLEDIEKFRDLINVVLVPGDEVRVGEDNVHFARIGGAIFGVEERDVDREEETVVEADGFGLIRRRRKLFDRDRMDVEIFLEMENILRSRIGHIDPRDRTKRKSLHVFRTYVFYWTENNSIIPYMS